MTVRLVAFSGSLRSDSFTRRLARRAAQGARDVGADVEELDLLEFPMPLFNEDDESATGIPAPALAFRQKLIEADGMLVASPEYNGSYSGALKNAIDWASRPRDGEPVLACFKGKVAAVMSGSPGGLGGIRMLPHLRALLCGIGVEVISKQLAVGNLDQKLAADGSLNDATLDEQVRGLGKEVAEFARALKNK